MKRIDTVNARPDANGAGKAGFHDNADISGQDATYVSPSWLNHIQEELSNILEKNGVSLNSNVRDQLYQLLATTEDIDALATATQQKINNEITARENADNQKYNKTGGTISGDVTVTGGLNVQGIFTTAKLALGTFLAAQNGFTALPNGLILQWGKTNDDFANHAFPMAFPSSCFAIVAQQISGGGTSKVYVEVVSKSHFKVYEGSDSTNGTEFYWFAIGC